MTAEAAGAVPDDVIEEARMALVKAMGGDDYSLDSWVGAVFSVPSVAEVFARDAKVREIVAETTADMADESEQPMSYTAADGFDSIAALYSEDGTR